MHLKTIAPGIGLGILRFGHTFDQVRDILGSPEHVAEDIECGEKTVAWYYRSRGLTLNFDEKDGFNLGTIEVSDPKAEFNGQKIIGITKEAARLFLSEGGIDFRDESDHLVCFDLCMNLWIEEDKVSEIQWWPLLDGDGPIRPNKP
jgi:hypothetical protein